LICHGDSGHTTHQLCVTTILGIKKI